MLGISAHNSFSPGSFRQHLDCAHGGIVDCRGKVNLKLALRRSFDVGEGFYQGAGPGFAENVETLQQHASIAGNIKDATANTSDRAAFNSKPMLQEVELHGIPRAGRDGHNVMEMAVTVPFEETAIRHLREVFREAIDAAAEEVAVRRPGITFGIPVEGGAGDDADRNHAV